MKPASIAGAIVALISMTGAASFAAEPYEGEYRLTEASGAPGTEVSVPMTVWGNEVILGVVISLDFDEEVLQAVGVDELWTKPDASAYDFKRYNLYNDNATPGNAGVDEGYAVCAVVFDFAEPIGLPANTDTPLLAFRFQILPDTPIGTSTQVAFVDSGTETSTDEAANNFMVMQGVSVPSVNVPTTVLVNARINIVGDLSLFVRGDANSDGTVNLSDAVSALSYLFLGSASLGCADAADANDDGRLDVSDPIRVLNTLFLSGVPLPAPSGSPGQDPTPDDLECARGTS